MRLPVITALIAAVIAGIVAGLLLVQTRATPLRTYFIPTVIQTYSGPARAKPHPARPKYPSIQSNSKLVTDTRGKLRETPGVLPANFRPGHARIALARGTHAKLRETPVKLRETLRGSFPNPGIRP